MKKYILSLMVLSLFMVGCGNQPAETETGQPSASNEVQLEVQKAGKLIVGSAVPYRPMELFDDDGNITGLDIDIAKEIASKLGVTLEIVDVEWDDLFTTLKAGDINLAMSAITITEERQEEMLFSSPYFNGGQVIVVLADNDTIKSPEDLKDKKIGVQVDTTSEDEALKIVDESSVVGQTNYDPVKEDLKNGNIDAFIIDYIAGVNYVQEDSALKIAGEPFTEEFYGIATQKTNQALMTEINTILREMKRDGKLKEINDKWLR